MRLGKKAKPYINPSRREKTTISGQDRTHNSHKDSCGIITDNYSATVCTAIHGEENKTEDADQIVGLMG